MSPEARLGGPGLEVVEKARAAIDRYGMLDDGDRILVTVSGGADSTCLLDVLARLATERGYVLAAAHVDHGLSPGSEKVAATVSHAVAEAGFEAHVIKAPDLAGPNLHARAREFRYRFFETIAETWGATRIATGHTLDDRVETTLARLIHGAGTDALAGLPPADGRRIRPLVGLRRAETRDYCAARSLTYYDDPANYDDRFERVVVRRDVVSAIEARWGEGAIRAMAVSADRLREDAVAMRDLADRIYEGMAKPTLLGTEIDMGVILETPRAFRRRILERAVGRVRDRSGGIDAALDALDARQRQARGTSQRFAVAAGIEIEVAPDKIVVRREPPTAPPAGRH
ncbi:MAG TPA: tRNA lysidine(34) synthetase TilS [Actinomycetota bacterium]